MLFSNGVSFAGVMAFIFSDLVVLPVLRIQAKYYGWRFALYVLGVLVAATIAMHYGFQFAGLLPDPATAKSVTERDFFQIDYTFFLNLGFIAVTLAFLAWRIRSSGMAIDWGLDATEKVLFALAMLAYAWLLGGWLMAPQFPG